MRRLIPFLSSMRHYFLALVSISLVKQTLGAGSGACNATQPADPYGTQESDPTGLLQSRVQVSSSMATDLTQRPERPVVLGMACNFKKSDLYVFLTSLRATGYNGAILLGMSPKIDHETQELLHKHAVQTNSQPCREQARLVASRPPCKAFCAEEGYGMLNQRRWHHYRQWIQRFKFTDVWALDVRDIFFQADPFSVSSPPLAFFSMAPNISYEEADVIETCAGKETRDALVKNKARSMCLGTVRGTADEFMDFAERMTTAQGDFFKVKKVMCHNHDQPPGMTVLFDREGKRLGHHNDAYEGGAVTFFPHVHGGACYGDNAKEHLNAEGKIINTYGEVIPILHRWDDCPTARAAVHQSLGLLDFVAPELTYGNLQMIAKPEATTGAWTPKEIEHRGWEAVNECAVQAISQVMKHRHLTSVADYGAGNGYYAKRLTQLGYSDVHCYDGNVGIVKKSGGLCSVTDLGNVQTNLPQVDLVYSLEVGEHIPKAHEAAFMDNLAHAAKDSLILSWALPHQPGVGHVNCQPNSYVIKKMKERGFDHIKSNTMAIRRHISQKCPQGWNTINFKRTLMMFRRSAQQPEHANLVQRSNSPDKVTGAWTPEEIAHRGWEAVNECAVQSISKIMKKRHFTSVADYGAGNGFYAKRLTQLGLSAEAVHCYDGNAGIVNKSGGLCSMVDLSSLQPKLPKVDLVYSLEVGEHIPKDREAAFMDNLAHAAKDMLMLSWALPHQPGVGHVNCQPNSYVIQKMKERGFVFRKSFTAGIRSYISRKCPKGMNTPNFKRTIMVFRRIQA